MEIQVQSSESAEAGIDGAMSIRTFCRDYDISETTFHEEVKDGRLSVKKLGVRTLIAREEARRWFKALPGKGSTPTQ